MSQPSLQASTSGPETLCTSRRRSANIPASEPQHFHRQLPKLFSSRRPSGNSTGSDESYDSDDRYGEGFMAPATSYSRTMHQHTRDQMRLGTLPGYTKTMHAFTKNQMSRFIDRRASRSEHSSLHVAARSALLPQELEVVVTRLTLDEEPQGPVNSPVLEGKQSSGFVAGAGRKRSLTEPMPRDFAAPAVSHAGPTVAL